MKSVELFHPKARKDDVEQRNERRNRVETCKLKAFSSKQRAEIHTETVRTRVQFKKLKIGWTIERVMIEKKDEHKTKKKSQIYETEPTKNSLKVKNHRLMTV